MKLFNNNIYNDLSVNSGMITDILNNYMKAVLISHNQALTEGVKDILDALTIRGFTQWTDVNGRSSTNGESHMGTHTWPSLNNVLIIVIPDEKVKPLLEKLSELNQKDEEEGLRAFVLNVENTI